MPRVACILLFFELGKAEAGVVVDGLGGECVEAFGIFAELIDQLTKIVAGNASSVEKGRQVVIINPADEADVRIVGAQGDGPIHAIAAGHEVAEFSWANKSVAAGEGVGTAEVDEKDTVFGLFGGKFFEPGD